MEISRIPHQQKRTEQGRLDPSDLMNPENASIVEVNWGSVKSTQVWTGGSTVDIYLT